MEPTINPNLRQYIETEIIPRYKHFDAAHQADHARYVIEESLNLAEHYPVNVDMVYAIAAYHDTGLTEGRKIHHLASGKIIREDSRLKEFFSETEIETMAQAAEDHRASNQQPPRSIYGMIVAEADRCIDGDTIIRRTIQYGLSHYPTLQKKAHYQRFLTHMKEKYAEGGYLKIWLPQSNNARRLKEFQIRLADEKATQQSFDRIWKEVHGDEQLTKEHGSD